MEKQLHTEAQWSSNVFSATLPARGKIAKRSHSAADRCQPLPRSTMCCQAAMSRSDANEALASTLFTQPLDYRTVEQPSKQARYLEQTFWHHPVIEVPATRDEALVMMERLHQETAVLATSTGVNVVAFTGGNGPALAAYLLNNLFDGGVIGCIGDTEALSAEQVEHATFVADLLGIDLIEVDHETWSRFEIPDGLEGHVEELCNTLVASSCRAADVTMFSGATADDVAHFSREGRHMHGLQAPLASLSRAAVNSLSKIAGLPPL